MTATGTGPEQTEPAKAPGRRLTPGQIVFRVVAGLIVAASFAVWGYAYSGLADRDAPDLLADEGLAAAAERICAVAVADVAEMPAALDAVDGEDRAGQVRATTARFEAMVGDLEALSFDQERDRRIYSLWLEDWRVLLGDRLTYAGAIAEDPNAQFLITDTGVNERLDRRITRFATTNRMISCGAPTDVG